MNDNITSASQNLDDWLLNIPKKKHLPFEFENVDVHKSRLWCQENMPLLYALSFTYFIFVQVGPAAMRNRQPFNLQKPLIVWNFLLAVFSIMGACRTIPTFLDALQQPNGVYKLSCVREGISQPLMFWTIAFCGSKLVEFGDTVFIVLRKKPLLFLHWFHHLTMFYGVFIAFIAMEPVSVWTMVINYSIHSLMYTYYTIMALKCKVPKKISMAITSLQLLQFVAVIFVNVYTIGALANGVECARDPFSIRMQLSFGLIYLVLFTNFFYKSYIVNTKKKTV